MAEACAFNRSRLLLPWHALALTGKFCPLQWRREGGATFLVIVTLDWCGSVARLSQGLVVFVVKHESARVQQLGNSCRDVQPSLDRASQVSQTLHASGPLVPLSRILTSFHVLLDEEQEGAEFDPHYPGYDLADLSLRGTGDSSFHGLVEEQSKLRTWDDISFGRDTDGHEGVPVRTQSTESMSPPIAAICSVSLRTM